MRSRVPRWIYIAVPALMLLLWAQMLHSIRGQSLTWDEGDHIFAGYESLKTHDFGYNPEHPPMVKMVAALPLLPLSLKVPPDQHRFFKNEAYLDGRELLYRNAPAYGGHYDAGTLIFRARMAASVFTLIAALLVFLATTEMFNLTAGIIALLLFCFEPNLVAHGAYVATDMAASCTIFATIYAFWRWVKRPTVPRLLIAGVVGGIALAAKHSTILLAPMLLLLAAVCLIVEWRQSRTHSQASKLPAGIGRMVGALAVITVVAVVALWAFYGFRYSARPAGLAMSPSLAEYVKPLAAREANGIRFLAHLHILPESWLYGLADVRLVANGMPSFLLGRVYNHGTWTYFPLVFLIKSTLAMLALLALTCVAVARRWLPLSRELWFVVIPPIVYMAVSMGSHLNIGARHILPVFLFCCVLAGVGASVLIRRGRAWSVAVAALLIFHVATTVHASPNFLSYANEAWGGPTKTYRYLSDSNTDWAQQLIAVSAALHARNVQHCYFAYFAAPFILPSDYAIPCELLPTVDSYDASADFHVPPVISGPVLISAGDLNGFEFGSKVLNPYESFRALTPTRFIQDGVFWFDGTFAVPLASAIPHVVRSTDALKAHNLDLAIAEARQAERLAPGEVAPEIALGDALAAAKRPAEARAAYGRAAEKIETMEPGAREDWRGRLAKKLASVASQ
ncbi:MAG TPA: glycosyltransferase family 39 protein [Acidobacteriaceae bacterium]|nr:glycosyltransferase family 39 protein [Acidobacteriaceae bacterium]